MRTTLYLIACAIYDNSGRKELPATPVMIFFVLFLAMGFYSLVTGGI